MMLTAGGANLDAGEVITQGFALRIANKTSEQRYWMLAALKQDLSRKVEQ